MAPRNDGQLGQLRDERREQIKKAALKVFARRGIIGTKMSMIADEAGISQGLTYRYFSSKEELFTALVQEAMEETAEAFNEMEQMSGTPSDKIRALTREMLDESNRHSFMLIQQVQTSDEVPEKAREIVEQYSSQALIDRLLPVFIKGQETGEFCLGDPQKLLFLYFSVIAGLMLQQAHGPYHVPDVQILMKMLANNG
ncbi:TetR/AcrR family transcriptional regulator [Paenibacillus caui]|uniref:TetR/AcrR family transcriptional regulator n=1 Tax=Paenibacillus caui TaxID=2873927 RepID=UPI001CA7E6D8|nr:TetR/AcrR family transcriptional regulator [Paenibacillus caui]